MRIPERQAITLEGQTVRVPTDFTGTYNAALFMFQPSHFVVLNAWRSALRGVLSECEPSTGFYAVALAGAAGPWRQKLAAWALRLDVNEPFLREHTALIFTDVKTWQREAAMYSIDEPLLVVTTPDGRVTKTAVGSPSRDIVTSISVGLKQQPSDG